MMNLCPCTAQIGKECQVGVEYTRGSQEGLVDMQLPSSREVQDIRTTIERLERTVTVLQGYVGLLLETLDLESNFIEE